MRYCCLVCTHHQCNHPELVRAVLPSPPLLLLLLLLLILPAPMIHCPCLRRLP